MKQHPRIAALIVAAGTGQRTGGNVPKQYQPIGGRAMLAHSVRAMLDHPGIAAVQVVIHPDHQELYQQALTVPSPVGGLGWSRAETLTPVPSLDPHSTSPLPEGLLLPITGGAERAQSVRAGLEALVSTKADYVLIHDAARPFVSHAVIDRLIGALTPDQGVVPVLPVNDTVRRRVGDGWEPVAREGLMRMQTPQAFPFTALVELYAKSHANLTDDAALWLDAGRTLAYVEGEERLHKVTTQADMNWANGQMPRRIATASGFDVHRLVPAGPAQRIRLGGIDIEYHHSLHGHSDGDVALHAITDALLGAMGEGDIGQHFPPGDAQWRGADSAQFVAEAIRLVEAKGGVIQHVDLTLICETPKIGPHRDAMRTRIADMLGLPVARISVKATTTETLGFTGRGEGIAAHAVATVSLPMEVA